MTLFVDLDEVFTDFVGGVLQLFGQDRVWLEKYHTPGVWDISHYLKISFEEVLIAVDKKPDFWRTLDPLPWAEDLKNLLEEVKCPFYIVTSPGRFSHAYTGKVNWLKRFFGNHFDAFFITNHKHILAREGSVLIDDRPDNINNFEDYGGEGILFPSFVNPLYKLRHDPLDYVRSKLCLKQML